MSWSSKDKEAPEVSRLLKGSVIKLKILLIAQRWGHNAPGFVDGPSVRWQSCPRKGRLTQSSFAPWLTAVTSAHNKVMSRMIMQNQKKSIIGYHQSDLAAVRDLLWKVAFQRRHGRSHWAKLSGREADLGPWMSLGIGMLRRAAWEQSLRSRYGGWNGSPSPLPTPPAPHSHPMFQGLLMARWLAKKAPGFSDGSRLD